jgi:hypothetical protein
LVDLAARTGDGTDAPFISKLMVSSKETGWAEEPVTVERCTVLATGPVRTVVAVRKTLNSGYAYEKTYTFYPRRIDVLASINKPLSLLSRAYYTQSGGSSTMPRPAVIDGQGDDEGVSGKNPSRSGTGCMRSAGHTPASLSRPVRGLGYWDAGGAWGGVGFDASSRDGVRRVYVIHSGAHNAAFAEADTGNERPPPPPDGNNRCRHLCFIDFRDAGSALPLVHP